MNEELKKAFSLIENNKTKFIGEGKWEKDAAYQVHQIEEKYYAIIVYDNQSRWLMDDSIIEITEDEIKKYI